MKQAIALFALLSALVCSCSVPVNFQVDDFDRDAQRVKLNGPADANGFFPHLLLTVLDSPYDLSDCSESRELRAVKDYDGYRNTLCVLDEDCSLYGKEAHRLMILYNTSDERMNIWYSIYTNVEGYGVNIVYTAYSATRTIPGDLEEVDRIVKNIAF